MPRINIEDSVFREQGFQDLLLAVGNRHVAKGMVLELFELGQKYWVPDRKLIPIEKFKNAGLDAALYGPGGLAELDESGDVYVRGCDKFFSWLMQKYDAGKKGGRPVVIGPNRSVIGSNPLTLTLTLPQKEKNNTSVAVSQETTPQRQQKFPLKFNSVEELIGSLPKETLDRWGELYPDKDFLKRESLKAFGYYCHDNPKKRPASRSGWCRALGSWFERSWPNFAKSIPGKKRSGGFADV